MTHGKMETNIIKNGLTKVIKRPPVDIQFENISYSAGKSQISNCILYKHIKILILYVSNVQKNTKMRELYKKYRCI